MVAGITQGAGGPIAAAPVGKHTTTGDGGFATHDDERAERGYSDPLTLLANLEDDIVF